MEVITCPDIPYWGTIPGGLKVGRMILVSGHVKYGASRFNIDFSRGDNREVSDIALHFNPRFNQNFVVRNSHLNGKWQNEEREPLILPFSTGKDFDIIFLVESSHFKIAVNGRHFVEFKHRLPIDTIDKLNIEGNITIKQIEYTWKNITSQLQVCCPDSFMSSHGSSFLQPVYNPEIPFTYHFHNGIEVGMMIYISGRPFASPERLDIDFQCSTAAYPIADIALHFNPRFNQQCVVRNSRINENWGTEEKSGGFPFTPGVYFDLIIFVECDKFTITINGKLFTEYRHRLMPLSRIDSLVIERDVLISGIRFQ